MNLTPYVLLIGILIFYLRVECQPTETDVIASLTKLSPTPEIIEVTNHLDVPQKGGHLQGIQVMSNGDQTYTLVSGSSDKASYLVSMAISNDKETVDLQTLMPAPLKHAGGFQIQETLLAIGIEDNDTRKTSLVNFYRVRDPAAIPRAPILSIERKGLYERATAGCVGFCFHQDQILLVVADWDSRHLDFYRGFLGDSLSLMGTVETKHQDKTDWVNPNWLSYQNINLFHARSHIYLLGFATDAAGQNVADLFRVDEEGNHFVLTKLATKIFEDAGGKFRWGAGAEFENGLIKGVYTCQEHLKETSYLYYYH